MQIVVRTGGHDTAHKAIMGVSDVNGTFNWT